MATKSTAVKLTLKITSFIIRMLLNIIFYILVVFLIVNFSKSAYAFAYQIYGPVTFEEAPGKEVVFQIKKGDSKMDIATKLQTYRVIENKYPFYLKTKLTEYVIKPGTYVINSAMTYEEILSVITDYSKSIVKDEDSEKALQEEKKQNKDEASQDDSKDTENAEQQDEDSDLYDGANSDTDEE
jgi:UPF0755 protein